MHYPSLIASTLQVVSHGRHNRSSPLSGARGVTKKTSRSRTPSPPATVSSYSSSQPDSQWDGRYGSSVGRHDPYSPPHSAASGSSWTMGSSIRSGSTRADRYDEDQSYLSFDDDSDTDYDELDEITDWSYVQVNGRPFPMPRMSLAPPLDKPLQRQQTAQFSKLPPSQRSSTLPASHHQHPRHPQYANKFSGAADVRLLRELSARESEPIAPLMEPSIFADDGAQGDWRQMVDIFIRDDELE